MKTLKLGMGHSMNLKLAQFVAVMLLMVGDFSISQAATQSEAKVKPAQSNCAATLNFSFRQLSDAASVNLCEAYQGKLILIVNTASRCGFTPQFAGLEKLYQDYKDRGFVILGFPSNDFGSQELNEEKDIAEFCQLTYGVKFPMFEKTHASKPIASPFYKTLGELAGEYPQWNFHKYVINQEGKLIGSFASHVKPDNEALRGLIEKNL